MLRAGNSEIHVYTLLTASIDVPCFSTSAQYWNKAHIATDTCDTELLKAPDTPFTTQGCPASCAAK
jgi:hypothetical protein